MKIRETNMKRIYLSLLLLCWVITAISIPAFIQNQSVIPTPEQIEVYQRKVREKPDEYSFNPMHPNDYWIYEIAPPFPGGPIEYGYFSIFADTLINGIPHFKAGRIGSDRDHWLKNDGDVVYLYDTDDFDNNSITDYLRTENFSSTSGISDTLYWSLGAGFPYEQTLAYIGTSFYLSIFGELVEAKDCWYLSAASCNLIWARKFGIGDRLGPPCCELLTRAIVVGYIAHLLHAHSALRGSSSPVLIRKHVYVVNRFAAPGERNARAGREEALGSLLGMQKTGGYYRNPFV